MKTIEKDVAAILDYAFNWSDWLIPPDEIASYVITITPDGGVTNDGDGETGGKVTVLLSGGTLHATVKVDCAITTTEGRTDSRTIRLLITDR